MTRISIFEILSATQLFDYNFSIGLRQVTVKRPLAGIQGKLVLKKGLPLSSVDYLKAAAWAAKGLEWLCRVNNHPLPQRD